MRSTAIRVLILIVCVLGIARDAAQAQVLNAPVQQSLRRLIADLQVKIERQARGDRDALLPQGPIDPALKTLGPVTTITLSAPVAAQGLVNFTARVVHENGVSDWQIGVLPNGQIAAYTFQAHPRAAPPRMTSARHKSARMNTHVAREPRVSTDVRRSARTGAGFDAHVALPNDNAGTMRRLEMDIARPQVDIAPAPESNVGPAAPPPPTTTAAPIVNAPAPPRFENRLVEFLIATTREKTVSPAGMVTYTGERAPLSFAAAAVRIPDDHKAGRIELPFSWKIFGMSFSLATNEHKHFIIKRVTPMTEAAFGDAVRANGSKTALVFVHGFNTPFEDALYRNAQIVWDLQYQGVSVLFTWASRGGSVFDYVYDGNSAMIARGSFITLLEKLRRDYGVETVNVLAHSMGNRIVLDALANYASTANPVQIARLIMAAPDVDRGVFQDEAPKAKAIVGGMTLYASSADRAMAASRTAAGGIPPAGDVPADGPIVMPGLETVDVTAAGDEFLGINHDVFAASRDVINDISAVLNNRPPPRLTQMHAVPDPPSLPRYWKFVPTP